ncbi:MAG: Maf family nucleotide pyrophosphatase [Microgenomates group bacterium]|jgi:septum formation protein
MKLLILASASHIRQRLLGDAGLAVTSIAARIDEQTIKASLEAEHAKPRDIADALAEMKARKVSEKHPDALVIGCDQVLDFQGTLFSKPQDTADLRAQLTSLRGKTHKLLSAVVLYENGKPVWRDMGEAQLTMRAFSDAYLDAYIDRHATTLLDSVGGYKLEEEGVRLFSKIEGDYFTILGLPLLPLLNYLNLRGYISG